MKNLFPYLAVLLAIGLSACKERTDAPETKACEKAALELYCKYADNEDLTVAYLGDLSINGKSIDALMLQANEEGDWEMLKQDFGMMPCDTAAMNCPSDDKHVSVGVGIETDFLDDAIFDTLTDVSQIPEEDIEKYTLIVAGKIREIMNSFQTPDSLLSNTAIIVGQGEIEREASDNTYDDYIMTVSRAIIVGLINERIQKNAAVEKGEDSINSADQPFSLQQQREQGDRIMDDAQSHGHIGYVTAADYDNWTLWLFFYDDQDECNTIITHIREDIIINK
jgi:hypothetical protein